MKSQLSRFMHYLFLNLAEINCFQILNLKNIRPEYHKNTVKKQ